MITALDTNVLIDLSLGKDPAAREAFRRAGREGALVFCEVVYAECAAGFPAEEMDKVFSDLGASMVPSSKKALSLAGDIWRFHLRSGGRRGRILPDFLIGAHALCHADRLLTRDLGFYRKSFKNLSLLEP